MKQTSCQFSKKRAIFVQRTGNSHHFLRRQPAKTHILTTFIKRRVSIYIFQKKLFYRRCGNLFVISHLPSTRKKCSDGKICVHTVKIGFGYWYLRIRPEKQRFNGDGVYHPKNMERNRTFWFEVS